MMTYSKPMKKLRVANRAQMAMVTVDVERLVGEEHAARAIWELTGQFDLSLFAEPIQSAAGEAGRPAWDPRLLVSVWLYAYSQGIGSAREIERQMAYEPGLEWLCGLEVINHHTLSDFRVQHGAALDELFVQMLAVLDQTGAIGLERVMHDGTKVKAQASGGSFRREKTLRERLEQARQLVAELKAVETEGESRTRQQAACERAARERVGRLEEALTELEREKRRTRSRVKDKRVSVSDPESRVMKQSDGGFAPSYNVQISTDARASVVVGVGVSQEASDHGELMPALERVVRNLGTQPRQVVADGGYATRDNIARTGEAGMELIAPVRDATAKSAGALRRAGIDWRLARRASSTTRRATHSSARRARGCATGPSTVSMECCTRFTRRTARTAGAARTGAAAARRSGTGDDACRSIRPSHGWLRTSSACRPSRRGRSIDSAAKWRSFPMRGSKPRSG